MISRNSCNATHMTTSIRAETSSEPPVHDDNNEPLRQTQDNNQDETTPTEHLLNRTISWKPPCLNLFILLQPNKATRKTKTKGRPRKNTIAKGRRQSPSNHRD
ncbi:hypothetical protein Bca4012_002475 [Brassica carinata]|uniref:Uncharacterized protein n=1 Tax=Brassica carinata TaxID=52824 RepID=A0A8X7Q616_BRACI|nr:hypothetical protein Bca52824_071563 [Brassica carinata]